MEYVRQVVAYKHYFLNFYEAQPDNVQSKIEWTLNLIRITKQIPEKYFKHKEGAKGLCGSGQQHLSYILVFRQRECSGTWKCLSEKDTENTQARNRKGT